jgi:hypothetical protein
LEWYKYDCQSAIQRKVVALFLVSYHRDLGNPNLITTLNSKGNHAMTLLYETDPQTLARRLTGGLHDALERAIKAELMVHADKIVTKVAHEMAQSLHGMVHSTRDHMKDQLIVQLALNGVVEIVPPSAQEKTDANTN